MLDCEAIAKETWCNLAPVKPVQSAKKQIEMVMVSKRICKHLITNLTCFLTTTMFPTQSKSLTLTTVMSRYLTNHLFKCLRHLQSKYTTTMVILEVYTKGLNPPIAILYDVMWPKTPPSSYPGSTPGEFPLQLLLSKSKQAVLQHSCQVKMIFLHFS